MLWVEESEPLKWGSQPSFSLSQPKQGRKTQRKNKRRERREQGGRSKVCAEVREGPFHHTRKKEKSRARSLFRVLGVCAVLCSRCACALCLALAVFFILGVLGCVSRFVSVVTNILCPPIVLTKASPGGASES